MVAVNMSGDKRPAFSVAGIIYRQGKLLLGKRINQGFMGGRWEFLGGKVEAGEGLEEALAREFKEETGVSVFVGSFICSSFFRNNNGEVKLSAFSVKLPDNFSLTEVVLPEHSELSWFPVDKVENLHLVDSDRNLLPAIKEWISTLEDDNV